MEDQAVVGGVDFSDPITDQIESVLIPETVLKGLGGLVRHMPHEDVHQGGPGIVVLRIARDDGDSPIRPFAPQSDGGGNAGDPISNDGNVQSSCS